MRHGTLLCALLGRKTTGLRAGRQARRNARNDVGDREPADHKAGDDNAQKHHVANNNAQVGSQNAGDAAAYVATGLDGYGVCHKGLGGAPRRRLVKRNHCQNRHDDKHKARRHAARDGALVCREESHGKDKKRHGHKNSTGAKAQGQKVPHRVGHGSRRRRHDRDEHSDGQHRQNDTDDVALGSGQATELRGLCLRGARLRLLAAAAIAFFVVCCV